MKNCQNLSQLDDIWYSLLTLSNNLKDEDLGNVSKLLHF